MLKVVCFSNSRAGGGGGGAEGGGGGDTEGEKGRPVSLSHVRKSLGCLLFYKQR